MNLLIGGAEVGYAYAKGVPVIALTDKTHEIPLILRYMISPELRVEDLDAIDQYIDELVALIRETVSKKVV